MFGVTDTDVLYDRDGRGAGRTSPPDLLTLKVTHHFTIGRFKGRPSCLFLSLMIFIKIFL